MWRGIIRWNFSHNIYMMSLVTLQEVVKISIYNMDNLWNWLYEYRIKQLYDMG